MNTTTEMAIVLGKRHASQSASALAEIVLLNEIRATLSVNDLLHAKIVALFNEDGEVGQAWNEDFDRVLAEARRRLV